MYLRVCWVEHRFCMALGIGESKAMERRERKRSRCMIIKNIE